MYIVPYYTHKRKGDLTNSIELTVAWVFMKEGGRKIWKTDGNDTNIESIIQEYLVENGFFGNVKEVIQDTIYYEIDTTKTQVDNYYRWLEDDTEEMDIWRPWFLVEGGKIEENKQIEVLRENILKI